MGAAPAALPAAAAGAAAAGPAAAIALFFPESRRDVKPRGRMFWRLFRPSVAWCFGVAKGAFWRLAAPAAAAAAGAAGPAGPASPAAELAQKGVCLLVSCLSSHQQQQQQSKLG